MAHQYHNIWQTTTTNNLYINLETKGTSVPQYFDKLLCDKKG